MLYNWDNVCTRGFIESQYYGFTRSLDLQSFKTVATFDFDLLGEHLDSSRSGSEIAVVMATKHQLYWNSIKPGFVRGDDSR